MITLLLQQISRNVNKVIIQLFKLKFNSIGAHRAHVQRMTAVAKL